MLKINKKIAGFTAAIGAVAAVPAHAELPAAVTSAFGSFTTTFSDIEAAAWPIISTVAIGFFLIRMFKRFTKSAS